MISLSLAAQTSMAELMPVRGLSIAAPGPQAVDQFVTFIEEELATCPCRNPEVARIQVQDMIDFRKGSTPEMKENFQGVILTSWSSAEGFMRNFYDTNKEDGAKEMLSIFEL